VERARRFTRGGPDRSLGLMAKEPSRWRGKVEPLPLCH
jgi:hypothetical protein